MTVDKEEPPCAGDKQKGFSISASLVVALGLLCVLDGAVNPSSWLSVSFCFIVVGHIGSSSGFPWSEMLFGVVLVMSGIGLLQLRKWSWRSSIVAVVLMLVYCVLATPDLVLISIGLVVLIYLMVIRDEFELEVYRQ